MRPPKERKSKSTYATQSLGVESSWSAVGYPGHQAALTHSLGEQSKKQRWEGIPRGLLETLKAQSLARCALSFSFHSFILSFSAALPLTTPGLPLATPAHDIPLSP